MGGCIGETEILCRRVTHQGTQRSPAVEEPNWRRATVRSSPERSFKSYVSCRSYSPITDYRTRSLGRPASIDNVNLSGGERRFIRGQINCQRCDLISFS